MLTKEKMVSKLRILEKMLFENWIARIYLWVINFFIKTQTQQMLSVWVIHRIQLESLILAQNKRWRRA